MRTRAKSFLRWLLIASQLLLVTFCIMDRILVAEAAPRAHFTPAPALIIGMLACASLVFLLFGTPFLVRSHCFDKSSDTNWLVPWHQDLSLALRARAEVPGFGPWSTKDGIPHVQPPIELLQRMLTVRLHLDDADESNGALRVLPGSHRLGRLSAERIQQLRSEQSDFLCTVSAGDALLMRPLLLHASSRSTSTRHRRVLHIEYAAFTLPDELDWHATA